MVRSVVAVLALVVFVSGETWSDDLTIYGAATAQARRISSGSLAVPLDAAQWTKTLDSRRQQWLEMIGLSPMPERTPLNATVTGTLERGDYVVEKVYFESIPGAYVIGNLYRPAVVKEKLPAVLYLCGHTKGKVSPTYQAHPRWFAQHGYVALVLDPIQLGESQGLHHGTYRDGRWDWHSRGYTPAGTEVWNAIRALDYLQSRPDVDADRMGVTGLSGGGVISWCLGAADERVKVVVPVCQSGSIGQVVQDRSTDGHCDCAFWVNHYQWCWPDIGSLIAPRAFLIASGSEDVLWRPSGYRDVAHRIGKQYAVLQQSDRFDLVEDLSPHGYTPKLRKAIFTWFNTHLKNDPAPVTDDVTDHLEPEANLLVFEGKLPDDDQMRQIDQLLVQRRSVPAVADASSWAKSQHEAVQRLKGTTFRYTITPGTPRLRVFRDDGSDGTSTSSTYEFVTSDGIASRVRTKQANDAVQPIAWLVTAANPEGRSTFNGGGGSRPPTSPDIATAVVEVRNTGASSVGPGYLWTIKRTYPLFGQSLPERQLSDLLEGISLLRSQPTSGRISVYGEGKTATLAIYAALLDPAIDEVVIANPPTTHESPETEEYLGVLRVGDLPHNLALVFPRRITFIGEMPPAYQWTQQLYERLGAKDKFRTLSNLRHWAPSDSN